MTTRPKNPLIKERLGKPKDLRLNDLPKNVSIWIAEPKLDGLRGIIVKPKNGKSIAYTSNGIEVHNAQFICAAIDKNKHIKSGWVFDGEFYTKDWNNTQSLVMTQTNHPEAKELRIRVFDILPFKDWVNKTSTPLRIRRAMVDRMVKEIDAKCITSVYFRLIKNKKKDILQAYNRHLKEGFEGLMLKDPHAEYPFKRSSVWLRHKPKITSDVKVIGIKWGKEGKTGQMLGLIGSLQCKFHWVDGRLITFNCSGMDMKMRRKLTRMYKKKELLGKIVEVEHEGVTRLNKVRFPQMQRLRLDKDDED